MKAILSFIILAVLFAACIKAVDNLPIAVNSAAPKKVIAVQKDTIPDGGSMKIQILKDSISTDETLMIFNHTADTRYINTQDAVYFPGYGAVSIASLTSDGMPCAIHKLPYIQGDPIGLKVSAKVDGIYLLKISYLNQIPQTIRVWLKD
jgi:hypothetical protein